MKVMRRLLSQFHQTSESQTVVGDGPALMAMGFKSATAVGGI